MVEDTGSRTLNELEARRILYLRAFDESDHESRYLDERLKSRVLAELVPDGALDPEVGFPVLKGYAAKLQARLEDRLGFCLSTFYQPWSFWRWLPLMAFFLGLGTHYLGGQNIHVLWNPFILLVIWNLSLFCVLVAGRLVRPRPKVRMPHMNRTRLVLLRLWDRLHGTGQPTVQAAVDARLAFLRLWSEKAAPLVRSKFAALLHLGALALLAGAVAGMYLRGLVMAFRFQWESTFIQDPELVRKLLATCFYPALVILGKTQPPSLNDGAGWIHTFALSGFLYVVVPRLFLWFIERRRCLRLGQHVHLDLEDAYFRQLFAQVRGNRTRIQLLLYGSRLDETQMRHLKQGLSQRYGAKALVDAPIRVAWGEPPPPLEADANSVFAVCFNGAQTPEPDEIHGPFMQALAAKADAAGAQAVAVVDSSALELARHADRRALWQQALASSDHWLWVDLTQAHDPGQWHWP